MMDEEIRQALTEVREMKKMCGNINMKLTNIVTQRGQDWKKKLEAEYQRGLNDAWECARKIVCDDSCGGMSMKELVEIFNKSSDAYILRDFTAQQAIEMLKAHEKKQADNKIGVGDVVETEGGTIFAVTRITADGLVVGFAGDGSACCFNITKLTKTGGHYNINEILGGLCDD